MSLPIHSPLITSRPTTLAQAVAQARHPRNHATAQLEPHREELLRLAQAGESAETLVGGLRLMGIEIGRETMRQWLLRESDRRSAKRRKSKHDAKPANGRTKSLPAPPTLAPPAAGDTAGGVTPSGAQAMDVSMPPS